MDKKNLGLDSGRETKSYSQYLLEEIFHQPSVVLGVLKKHLSQKNVIDAFGEKAPFLFGRVHRIEVITTDKSYHAGMIARFWLEEISGIPCQVEIAKVYLLREKVIESNKLCVILAETGDEVESLEALFLAKDLGYTAILGICNSAKSELMQESDIVLATGYKDLGVAIDLAVTQAFISQLTGLFLLAVALGRYHRLDQSNEKMLIEKLALLPQLLEQVLLLNSEIEKFGKELAEKNHAIYLGRGIQLPVAMEGASKLKELSAMNATAHPPEEFQVHPEAVFDLPVVALAPSYDFFDKWKKSFQDFRRYQYDVFVFSDKKVESPDLKSLVMPLVDRFFSPIVYTLPVQLLACHVGIHKEIANKPYEL